ncbi:tyrosine-type recombinase/integrase [Aureimonas altamirensis]|uniref:tyrosine-type recombinase/integrase n=1 Tax=Aureimonas TaxID=414371 RepID=UPI00177EC353|nr:MULTISPECIES: site-specific integrase [Aureimonas]MCM2505787.1 tyrosine-type recombinase/integrase [Aureimonas altamirensis]QOG05134.1 tyrosine-type recombinase/integrase [Aureimonas sp. OT7]
MPRKNLTARFVDSVSVETRTDFWDEAMRGLVLRVGPSGAKSWTFIYTAEGDGEKRRVTLGRHPALTLEKARRKALDLAAAVADGGDPASDKRASREAMTFADLAGLYVERYAKRNKKSWEQDDRLLRVEVLPVIGKKKMTAVTKRDVLDIIEAKAEAGFLVQSNRLLALLRKLGNWAVAEDYIAASPAAGVKPRSKPVSRDRVLSEDEVAAIWKALPGAALRGVTRDVFRLLLLTGQRSGEVSGMRRSEVDVDAALWTIPAARTKNGRAHTVPLSPAAMELVNARLSKAGEERDAPLFAHVDEPMPSNAIAHAARLKLQLFEDPWTPHDIRRTVATMMADSGTLPHVIEAVLNHISGFRAGVAGTYNRNAYDREKRQALDMWADRLDAIATGRASNISPMRRGAA